MQERYLGDSHDYIKFALLRHLHKELKLRIGVNWYLTAPENNGDGEQRSYLDKPEWKSLDESLFKEFGQFRARDNRTLKKFEQSEVLPKKTLYYETPVSAAKGRSRWHSAAIASLSDAGLVFLDQDNGFEVNSMSDRTQAKYLLYKEAFDYYNNGKVVVAIQFAAKVDPAVRVREVNSKLVDSKVCAMTLPVVRGRVTPNILFHLISPLEHAQMARKALEDFEKKSPTVGGFGRIELIREKNLMVRK